MPKINRQTDPPEEPKPILSDDQRRQITEAITQRNNAERQTECRLWTDLECVITHYKGLPHKRLRRGESHWECDCGGDIYTLPMKINPMTGLLYHERAKCWHCNWLGDAYDFVASRHPGDSHQQIVERVRAIIKASEKRPSYPVDEAEACASLVLIDPTRAIIGGRPPSERTPEACNEYLTWAREQGIDEVVAMRSLFLATEISRQNCVSLEALIGECAKRRRKQLYHLRKRRPKSTAVASGPRLLNPLLIGTISCLYHYEDFGLWSRTAKEVLYCEAEGTKMAVFPHEDQFGWWYQHREYPRQQSPQFYVTEKVALNSLRRAITGDPVFVELED